MELRQLKYFVKVAETLNFSLAARELFITQSTLSQQILNLERELSQQLFLRNSHEVILTEAGETLLPMARESIYAVDNCVLRLQELKNLQIGELNIGVTFSFSSIMAETMVDFLKKYPNVKLNVSYSSMAALIDQLKHHELDFVLAFKPNEADEHVNSQPLFATHLAAIVNENHPLATRESVTLSELRRYNCALPAVGLQARNAFEQVVAADNGRFRVKAEINNVNLLFKLVRSTNYVTILAESTVIDETGLRAIPIDMPSARMQGCIHTLKNAYLKKSAREFIAMLSHTMSFVKNSTLQDM